MNQIISCLAGGRNKMMAARAYDFYNAELVDSGLSVRVPETINNVTRGEIPLWIHSMGGHAVLKVPYSNAGTNNSPLWPKKLPSKCHFAIRLTHLLFSQAKVSTLLPTPMN